MHRITRYTVPAALCLSLLAVSPGLASATAEPAKPQAAVAGKAIPGTEALLAQVQSLGGLGGLLKPVTDLLAAILKSPDGKLPEADLAAFKEKIDAALAELRKTLPAVPALPVPVPPVDVPKLPVDPPKLPVDVPALPVEAPKLPVEAPKLPVEAPKLPVDAPALPVEAPKLPVEAPKLPVDAPKLPVALPVAARKAADGPLDLVTGAIDKLKASVDGLTKAAGPCGCSTDAKAKATDVVTDLVAALLALLTGAGLPGLPPLPVPAPALPVPALPVG
ncbi:MULTISPECIES: hypothetical protein [unclassified Streptomyces]|uniref:hypothetical protein n=1 Tax=unclassified Streptomyces TaxID=2593676 RepID=UPI000DC7D06C|nr:MULTISPECIES: hypothetical protein [unclassified Streptomyces]AWZ05647.1 hypothetical protein DRB89_14410 [Streptomyces sp. ICC4]AWZ13375.1 hypothetical protein DRB96_14810 [Streptomyces sp. ICC1]